ncbi:cysteine desulfurase [Fimbriiglobus ruber]|uniref:cysteine desulfurase n=1 Tax=Fimbriiglobus ruber TaxID=1908690 RepID=A0A225DNR5_9BACT|nr:cysteine desulfurase [Fimbriiglobus ruber]OWK37995.1 Cysteine desulfurase [Fimbriiglobus ruber]
MIYLDNAATSFPKPETVYQALDRYARTALANPGRGGHRMAREAADTLQNARHRLNRFLNGAGLERIIFTLNCTDGLNIAVKGTVQAGDHVVTTDLEHNSVSRPLVALAEAGVITLTRIPSDKTGTIDPAAIKAALTPKTRLVAVTHASNVLGTIQPVAEIGRLCREASDRVLVLVDAAQTAGVVPIDVQAMHVDLLAFPGHKSMFGPTGTGVLYVGPRAKPRAWREGGTGGDSTSPTQPAEYPHYLEGGTPNVLGVAGLVAGLDFVEKETPDGLRAHEVGLCERFCERLGAVGGFEFVGHQDSARKVGAVSFRGPDGFDSETLGGALDSSFGIAVRAGLHCSPYIHRAVGSVHDGLVRVSPGAFNTADEIDQLVEALKEITGGGV